MSFQYCCSKTRKFDYSLYHDYLYKTDKLRLVDLLWYLPEIESFQSAHGTPLSDDIYEDVFLKLTKDILKITDDDIKIESTTPDRTIDDLDAHYYEDSVCVNCSKIIIAQMKGKNKIVSLLSHIRNMIAHGYFNVVEDVFIGFDHPRYGGKKYTGVIKVKYDSLLELFLKFKDIVDTISLYKYILSNMGYEVIENGSFDALRIGKDNRKYYLEFKKFSGRYINQVDLEKYINERRHIDKSNCTYILIVDSTYSTAKINSYLVGQNICILDKKWVKELVHGKDIFKDLTEVQNKYKSGNL